MTKKFRQKIKTDLPLPLIGFLALLAIPRVVLHDLRLVDFDSIVYILWTVIPFLVWIGVAVIRKTKRPVVDFLMLGAIFGVFLALTHQLLWGASWGADVPRLGGNLAGLLSPFAESLILRSASVVSSLMTGVMTGAVLSILAVGAAKIRAMRK